MECFQINKNDKKYIMNHEPQFFLYPVPMSHCTYLYYHLTYHKLWAVAMTSLLCQQLFPINIVPKHLCEQNNCVRYSWTCTFTQDSHLPFQKKNHQGHVGAALKAFVQPLRYTVYRYMGTKYKVWPDMKFVVAQGCIRVMTCSKPVFTSCFVRWGAQPGSWLSLEHFWWILYKLLVFTSNVCCQERMDHLWRSWLTCTSTLVAQRTWRNLFTKKPCSSTLPWENLESESIPQGRYRHQCDWRVGSCDSPIFMQLPTLTQGMQLCIAAG